MKILFFTLKPPYPAIDGGCIAIKDMLHNLLSEGHEVKLVSLETHKHPFQKGAFPQGLLKKINAEFLTINTELKIGAALAQLVKGKSYNISRFFDMRVQQRLAEILEKETFDIIQMESLFTTPYLKAFKEKSDAKLVLRSHNLEHLIWYRQAANTKNPLKRWYLKQLAQQLKKYEAGIQKELDGIISISVIDAKRHHQLGFHGKSITVPVSMQVMPAVQPTTNMQPTFFHIGSMDWMPNVEGVQWLIKEVWPLVLKEIPDAVLKLAGRNFNLNQFQNLPAGVEIVGEVFDSKAFVLQEDIMVVPILSGGGIRIKIIEGLGLGKPVVTTQTGAEGIADKTEAYIILNEKAEDMACSMVELYNSEILRNNLSKNALLFAEQNYSAEKISSSVSNFYQTL